MILMMTGQARQGEKEESRGENDECRGRENEESRGGENKENRGNVREKSFIDMWLNFVERDDFFKRDGFHLTGKGAAWV